MPCLPIHVYTCDASNKSVCLLLFVFSRGLVRGRVIFDWRKDMSVLGHGRHECACKSESQTFEVCEIWEFTHKHPSFSFDNTNYTQKTVNFSCMIVLKKLLSIAKSADSFGWRNLLQCFLPTLPLPSLIYRGVWDTSRPNAWKPPRSSHLLADFLEVKKQVYENFQKCHQKSRSKTSLLADLRKVQGTLYENRYAFHEWAENLLQNARSEASHARTHGIHTIIESSNKTKK